MASGNMASTKLDEFAIRRNILSVFAGYFFIFFILVRMKVKVSMRISDWVINDFPDFN
jgi:hypothetical protein